MEERVIVESVQATGIWASDKHRFLIGSDPFVIGMDLKQELEKFGIALRRCLSGSADFFRYLDCQKNNWGAKLAKKYRVGLPEAYNHVKGNYEAPMVCKVDFVLRENGLSVVEVDGMSEQGFGYSVISSIIAKSLCPQANHFLGLPAALSRELLSRGIKEIGIFCPKKRFFYLSEILLFADELSSLGVETVVIEEDDIKEGDLPKYCLALSEGLGSKTIEKLIEMNQCGKVEFIIPPLPLFSSKGLLAFWWSIRSDQHLRWEVDKFISEEDLTTVLSFVSETRFLDKGGCLEDPFLWVVKPVFGTGSAGVCMPENDRHARAIAQAVGSCGFVIQRRIVAKKIPVRFLSKGGTDEAKMSLRMIGYFVGAEYKLENVLVTASRTEPIQGGVESVQLGSMIEV